MELFDATEYGIDLLTEVSFGWYLTNKLVEYNFPVVFRSDGTTPVNIVDSFVWVDDLERKDIVRISDYTDYRTQMVLPIVSYDFVSDTVEPIELGTGSKRKIRSLSVVIAGETKAQTINLSDFISTLLETSQIPINNYNITNTPQIGVITCEDTYITRLYNIFAETNLANKFSISVTSTATAEYTNTFER